MRTTIKIDDEVLDAARSLAEAEGRTVGEVVSRLARKGLEPRPHARARGAFPTFAVPPGAPRITPDMVRRAADET